MLKRFFFLSASGFILSFLFVIQITTTSCRKEVEIIDTVTVTERDTIIQKDTLVIKDTAMTPAILTANPWKIQYGRATYGSHYVFYTRGGTSNTDNFDNEYVAFNTNGTGIYNDNAGNQYTLTWRFADSSYTKLIWTWNFPPVPYDVTWENIVYKDGALHFTEYYVQFGNNVLGSVIRIPK